jgi:hypothetical protein
MYYQVNPSTKLMSDGFGRIVFEAKDDTFKSIYDGQIIGGKMQGYGRLAKSGWG